MIWKRDGIIFKIKNSVCAVIQCLWICILPGNGYDRTVNLNIKQIRTLRVSQSSHNQALNILRFDVRKIHSPIKKMQWNRNAGIHGSHKEVDGIGGDLVCLFRKCRDAQGQGHGRSQKNAKQFFHIVVFPFNYYSARISIFLAQPIHFLTWWKAAITKPPGLIIRAFKEA